MGKQGIWLFWQGTIKKRAITLKKNSNMDTPKNTVVEKLDFLSFIKKYFIQYRVDEHNQKIIGNLGLWAIRSEGFNNLQPGWHIDRGIFLIGPVGVGKDELFLLLRKYISYLRSPYGYNFKVVWEFAKPFEKEGHIAFQSEYTGNNYYEELALTDEKTGIPTREYVNHFGTKIFIGVELIHIRHRVFKNLGFQSHFSSNLPEEALEQVYGKRCMSRIYEMCNIMFLTGEDRRGHTAPVFVKNSNISAPPPPRETTVDEHEENRKILEAEYAIFLTIGNVSEMAPLNYHLLRSYGCQLCTDEEMRVVMEDLETNYVNPPALVQKQTKEKYKTDFVWSTARTIAVKRFYQGLKDGGAKTIFTIVDVSVDGMVNNLVKENKQQQ